MCGSTGKTLAKMKLKTEGLIGTRDDIVLALERYAEHRKDCDVTIRAGKGCEIPNFKGSYLGRFPLVLADFWTSDHLSERSRSVNVFFGPRARGTAKLKRR